MKPVNKIKQKNHKAGDERQEGDPRDRLALESGALTLRMLALVNQKTVGLPAILEMLKILEEFTGLEALAIRLRVGEDYPYFATRGYFSGSGAAKLPWKGDEAPDIISHSPGCDGLQCICGDVIRGHIDPLQPYFTEGGSFWTNGFTALLNSTAGKSLRSVSERRFCTEGHESVAIVPIRSFGEVMGLLLVKDTRENRFSLEIVRFLEAIAAIIGIAVARISAEETLRRSNEELELRVEERTAELLDINRLLEKEIRDRKAIQERLQMSQQRLDLAIRAGNLGSWVWNVDTGEVFYDQHWTEMLGYSLEETEPNYLSWQRVLHPDDKIIALERLRKCIKDPDHSYEIEYRMRPKSGGWKWILDRAQVVERDESGRAHRMAGVYIDVTERKRVEQELQQSEERLRMIFENARDCIYIKDSTLKYIHVNPAFEKMLDLSESQIVGRKDKDLYGRDAAEILKEMDFRILKGESIEQELSRRVRGVPVTFLDVKVPMRNSSGDIVGVFGIIRDITARKQSPSAQPSIGEDYHSPTMRSTLRSARLAAQTDTTILLTGESGSGKDHIARYIHDHSKRAHGPFFSINCAAISQELFESELFGYESGAFTGARGSKRGLLELAEGGTILLNEIGELSLPLQSKLLTFLDSRQFTRVGGVQNLTVSARLIAATNRDLEKEVRRNAFRQDLFYRLNVFSVEVPPLRERIEDLPILVSDMARQIASNIGVDPVPSIDHTVMAALASYHWPGNVRELRNVLERALILCDKSEITVGDLALYDKLRSKNHDEEWCVPVTFPKHESLKEVTSNLKRLLVTEALNRTGGRRKKAAELLGITPDALKHYMQIFDLYT